MFMRTMTCAAALLAFLPAAAMAQQATTAAPLSDAEVINLNEWRYDELYTQGWRAEDFWAAEVYGPAGEEIGDVENLIIGQDGKILSIIAEVGGLWDIGDTHVNVPWDQVEIAPGLDRITIPVTEENVGDYSLFKTNLLTAEKAAGETQVVDDDLATGMQAWKLTDLTNDYVRLRGDDAGAHANYGYVDDVIFSRDGELQAVVVRPDVGYGAPGYYAYPYYGYGYGWVPGTPYYDLPYRQNEIGELEPFDYERMGDYG